MSTKGYAVKMDKLGIMVNTVSETERAAKVNWLVSFAGYRIDNATTDETIDTIFEHHQDEDYGMAVVAVMIAELQ